MNSVNILTIHTIRYYIIPILISIVSSIIFFPFIRYVTMPNDEGFVISPADRILNKEKPYRDFIRVIPSGRSLLLAFIFKIGGVSWYNAKRWFGVVFLLLLILMYIASINVIDNIFFSILPIVMIIIYIFPHSKYNQHQYVGISTNSDKLILPLISVIVFVIYCKSSNLYLLLLTSIAIGISVITAQEITLSLITSILITIIFKGDNILNELSTFIFGILISILLLYIYINALGISSKDIWRDHFKKTFKVTNKVRLPYPKFNISTLFNRSFLDNIKLSNISERLYTIRFFIPCLSYLYLLCILITKKLTNNIDATDIGIFYILFFGITFLPYLIQRADYGHLIITLVPFYIIYAYIGEQLFYDVNNYERLSLYPLSLIIKGYFLSVFFILLCYDLIISSNAYIYHIKERGKYILLDCERGGVYLKNELYHSIVPVISYIIEHTQKDNFIFVVPAEPQIYLLTNRKNPTKIVSILPQICQEDEIDMLTALKDKKPAYIVYNKEEAAHSYQNSVPLKGYAPNLYDYIWNNYSIEKEIGRYLFLVKT